MIDQNAWWTIEHLQLKMDFLTSNPELWPESESYVQSKMIIESLNFVNDSAERGVRLTSDFLKAARNEDHFQNVLQVVEHNHFQKLNLRKKSK